MKHAKHDHAGHVHHAHSDHVPHTHRAAHGAAPKAGEAIDPVCGMRVDPASALSHRHGDETYYFCNPRCRDKFVAAPSSYLKAEKPTQKAEQATSSGTVWTWS